MNHLTHNYLFRQAIWSFLAVVLSTSTVLAQQPQIEKLEEEQVQQKDIERAQALSASILDSMANGSYYTFEEGEAIPVLVQQFTEEVQKQQYQMITSQTGEYQSALTYQEAYQLEQAGQQFNLYRFKGAFEKGEQEVRAVFTTDDKLAGLQILPWKDALY